MKVFGFLAAALILAALVGDLARSVSDSPTTPPPGRPTTQPATRPASQPAQPQTLTGTFNWTGKGPKQFPITAVVTSTGPNQWTAVYTFNWGGKNMTFKGAIQSDPNTAEVSGTGAPGGNNPRTFAFKGAVKNGVLTFNHIETTGGKTTSTGSGTLKWF